MSSHMGGGHLHERREECLLLEVSLTLLALISQDVQGPGLPVEGLRKLGKQWTSSSGTTSHPMEAKCCCEPKGLTKSWRFSGNREVP